MALICPLTHFYNINPKTKQLHRKERLIQPCVFSGGGTLCVLRQIITYFPSANRLKTLQVYRVTSDISAEQIRPILDRFKKTLKIPNFVTKRARDQKWANLKFCRFVWNSLETQILSNLIDLVWSKQVVMVRISTHLPSFWLLVPLYHEYIDARVSDHAPL